MALLRSNKLRLAAITGAATAALVGGLTALPAQAAPATGTVLAAGFPTAVDGSYIVTLKKGASTKASSAAGKGLIKGYGGTVTKTFGTVLNGYTASLSAAEAKRLAADPAIAAVEQNQRVHLTDTTQSSAPWGLDRIDQAALPLSGTYTYPDSAGSGVTVYVIDTGVRITHTQISGRAAYGYDAVDGDTTASDGNGHGTHVATTIAGSTYGVAKKANIVAVRVLDNSGSGTTAGVIAGIDWVTSNHTACGGRQHVARRLRLHLARHGGRQLHIQWRYLRGRGGQQRRQRLLVLPARVATAITVGATTSTDAKASYSNYGSILDIFAPGSSILAGYNTSDTATATLSGTSMATPHVAGAAAVYLSGHTSSTSAQVATALVSGATSGVVTSPGTGSPNLLLKLVS